MPSKNDRIHPLLPTRDEVNDNPDLMYSDHIPQLLQINQSLRVMTYNVYQMGDPCGYDFQAMIEKDEEYQSLLLKANDTPAESDLDYEKRMEVVKTARKEIGTRQEQLKIEFNLKRQERIAAGIHRAVIKQDLDVILLQEADKQQESLLRKQLGAQWVAVREKDHNLVIFYNKQTYKIHLLNKELPDATNDYAQAVVLINSWWEKIQVINFHGDGSPETADKKAIIDQLAAARPKHSLLVIAGDFNTPVNHMKGQVGVTSLVPSQFNYSYIEREDRSTQENRNYEVGMSIDGGLLLKPGAPVTKIEKIKPVAIDLSTGELWLESQLDASKTTIYQQKVSPIYQTEDEVKVEAIMEKSIAPNAYENPIQAREAVNILYQAGLLERGLWGFLRDNKPDDYLKCLASHKNPLALADAIKECKALGLLRTGIFGFLTGVNGQQNLKSLARLENPKDLVDKLKACKSRRPGQLQRDLWAFIPAKETASYNEAALNDGQSVQGMTSPVLMHSFLASNPPKTPVKTDHSDDFTKQQKSRSEETIVPENNDRQAGEQDQSRRPGLHC
ncbi:MAG: hypothetical protein CK426_06760 [Legionella sp.]|nr:MAG: hypothetical protein CK423_02620 [Legionella sp.]PJD98044.1 MAG: hypothetical protein CK426_06760 [Legionella sp.]